ELATMRPDPYGWNVAEHGSSVTVRYKVFGDRVDGTYLGVDTTHAHINMPAAIMWGHGLADRPVAITFRHALGLRGRGGTRLHPASPRFRCSAPTLQCRRDSPAEFGPIAMRQFTVGDRTFRFALHHTGTDTDLDAFINDVEKIVRQEGTIYGEYPAYEPGNYT